MKITLEDGFKPINIKIETLEEAKLMLAIFNAAPEKMNRAIDNTLSSSQICKIYRPANSKSMWKQMKEVLGDFSGIDCNE